MLPHPALKIFSMCVVQVASCMCLEDNFWKWVLAFHLFEAGTLCVLQACWPESFKDSSGWGFVCLRACVHACFSVALAVLDLSDLPASAF